MRLPLICEPEILLADEPTTALDVTVQAEILDLMKDLQKRVKTSIIFITHDLGVVAGMADRVAVMYAGEFLEYGTVDDIFYNPQHPYAWGLIIQCQLLKVIPWNQFQVRHQICLIHLKVIRLHQEINMQ